MFYTILYSTTKDRYYIGATENLEEQVKKHNYFNLIFCHSSVLN